MTEVLMDVNLIAVHCRQVTASFSFVFPVEWPESLMVMWSWFGAVMPLPLNSPRSPFLAHSCHLITFVDHDVSFVVRAMID